MVAFKNYFTKSIIEETRNFARQNSPCSRRKYGVLIVDDLGTRLFATNERVGKYCTPEHCIRDIKSISHGEQVEIGGEVHAEQSALIKYPFYGFNHNKHILIAGLAHNGTELVGLANIPCHVCAVMIKHAEFRNVWLASGDEAVAYSISEILERYEA